MKRNLPKITVIDPQTAGISGDMLLGALLDAGVETSTIQRVLNKIPAEYPPCKNIQLNATKVKIRGFAASRAELNIIEDETETNGDEFMRAAERIAETSGISQSASTFAKRSIKDIVYVESRLHASRTEKTHLHEAGSADTLADVFGVAAACDALSLFDGEIVSTPVAVGGGTVTFSHGKLAVPAPAVLEIARERNIPIRGGPEDFELATPTGMSMLANLAQRFVDNYPPLVPKKVGYGAGKRELQDTPNVLRLTIGEKAENQANSDIVQVLETNLDDLPGEVLGHALQRVIDSGAKDAWITSAQFKKNRPGHVLHVICDPKDSERLATVIMEETGTLGVRYQQWSRFKLEREIKTVRVSAKGNEFTVRVKIARDKSGKIVNVKPEFDDVQTIARDLSLPVREVSEIVLREARASLEKRET